ncbi:phosphonate metabolism transcriptional regulator PhnF [Alphaproteobacteria bacterium KMM 3653]|uniref:Phosphonate metabolism transcriptional regulator PhnF n=1 Tax=Harenicola maris TaxID=2841044 RepID=A0AAP2G760_9RHOB|nr:phosphonate metabolism transcriptional regulator PhnF [Harenicola maris]
MARKAIWKSIRDTLSVEIADGEYQPGSKLPTEAVLAERFSVNRHTVRRALADMAASGLVRSRRGAGVFVEMKPTDFPLGRRVRFSENVEAAGRVPDRAVLKMETRPADKDELEALGLPAGANVHVYKGVSFADRAPIAIANSVFPADRFPGLLDLLADTSSITEALARLGVKDYTRASTRVSAEAATGSTAAHLKVSESAPLLRSVSVNVDEDGMPIEFGQTVFVGDRVTLTMDELR